MLFDLDGAQKPGATKTRNGSAAVRIERRNLDVVADSCATDGGDVAARRCARGAAQGAAASRLTRRPRIDPPDRRVARQTQGRGDEDRPAPELRRLDDPRRGACRAVGAADALAADVGRAG